MRLGLAVPIEQVASFHKCPLWQVVLYLKMQIHFKILLKYFGSNYFMVTVQRSNEILWA